MPKIIKEYNKLPTEIQTSLELLNDIDGKEWARLSRSINSYNGPIAQKRREHGAAFPLSLAEHFLKVYTKKGDSVLDPFMGVGTVGDISRILGRNFFGFEISKKYFDLAKKGIDENDAAYFEYYPLINGTNSSQKLFNDSCLKLDKYIAPESINLIITSPPYANLLNNIAVSFASYSYSKNIYRNKGRRLPSAYSNRKDDFGNMSLAAYSDTVKLLMAKLYLVAKPGSYNVWVVRDYREMTSHVPYLNLHGLVIDAASKAGWILNDIVVWDQTKQRHLVKLGGKKSRRFYFNIGHSYILCFRKNIKGEKFTNGL